jgi:chromosome segregation ATPase
MAAAVMPHASQTAGAFRTAAELTCHDPTQLLHANEALESALAESQALAEIQASKIEELERRLESLQSTRPAAKSSDSPDSLRLLARIDDLTKENLQLERTQENLEREFGDLWNIQSEILKIGLQTLQKLPAAAEAKALFSRVNKQAGALQRARDTGKIRPTNALRELTDLQREVSSYMMSRPMLTCQRSEQFRAEVLVKALVDDAKVKSFDTPSAQTALTAIEGHTIHPEQALRAMRRAARLHPDTVKFEPLIRGRARLCKIDINGASK